MGVEVIGWLGIEPATLVTDLGGLTKEPTVVPVGICGWDDGTKGLGPTNGWFWLIEFIWFGGLVNDWVINGWLEFNGWVFINGWVGWINGRFGWINGWLGWINGWFGCINGWFGCINGWFGWINGWLDWINGWLGWIKGWLATWGVELINGCPLPINGCGIGGFTPEIKSGTAGFGGIDWLKSPRRDWLDCAGWGGNPVIRGWVIVGMGGIGGLGGGNCCFAPRR